MPSSVMSPAVPYYGYDFGCETQQGSAAPRAKTPFETVAWQLHNQKFRRARGP